MYGISRLFSEEYHDLILCIYNRVSHTNLAVSIKYWLFVKFHLILYYALLQNTAVAKYLEIASD